MFVLLLALTILSSIVLMFGVLALWAKMDDKRIAAVRAALVLVTMDRIGWSFLGACGQIDRRCQASWRRDRE
jgi:hypothetical protein